MAKEWLSINIKIPANIVEQTLRIYDERVEQAARDSAKVIKRRTVAELETREHVAERDLLNSLQIEIDKASSIGWIVSLTTLDIAANALEYGSDPTSDDGPVNVSNIVVWLEEKGIEPDYGTVEDYAFAIARKIGQLGMTVQGIPVRGNQKRPFNAAQKKAKTEIDRIWLDAISGFVGEFNQRG